jgi:poly(3-hydroxybutyrate) depolymerase
VIRRAGPVALSVLLLAFRGAAEPGKVSKEKVSSRGKERTFYLYVPKDAPPERKLPVIVTLHGSRRNGETLVSLWKEKAQAEKIVLAGPDSADSVRWNSPGDGPLLLHDIVEKIGEKYPIDGRRVFLFGHSAGAVFALQMAALESEYFAAAAIHAGSLEPAYFRLFDYATRKIPYAIWIGTRDNFFPLAPVQATRDALKSRGFPVSYTEILGHTHDYSSRAPEINDAVWEFFKSNPLPAEPKYTVYKDPD